MSKNFKKKFSKIYFIYDHQFIMQTKEIEQHMLSPAALIWFWTKHALCGQQSQNSATFAQSSPKPRVLLSQESEGLGSRTHLFPTFCYKTKRVVSCRQLTPSAYTVWSLCLCYVLEKAANYNVQVKEKWRGGLNYRYILYTSMFTNLWKSQQKQVLEPFLW